MPIGSNRHLPEIPVVELGAGYALALLEAEAAQIGRASCRERV